MSQQQQQQQQPRFRVAIIGSGIVGLAIAVGLRKYPDIHVDVYEAAHQFSEIGAGIGMTGRSPRVLKRLGMWPELEKIVTTSEDNTQFEVRKGDQEDAVKFHVLRAAGERALFHRAEFLDAFVKLLPEGTAHFGKRSVSFSEDADSGVVTIGFKDGTTATADLVLGADGIKSQTRAAVLEEIMKEMSPSDAAELETHVQPLWTGTVVYRGLIPSERLVLEGREHPAFKVPQMYIGKNKHLIVFPVSRGKYVNVAAFCSEPEKEGTAYEGPWSVPVTNEELVEQYKGWSSECIQMLKAIPETTKYGLFALNPLPSFSHGRIGIMGDAAHASTPHLGSGAGQGIEDAYVLVRLLSDPRTTRADIPALLRAYETVRVARAEQVVRMSRESGLTVELNSSHPEARNNMVELVKRLDEDTQWIWDDDSDEDADAQRAVRILHGSDV